jgi:ribosome-binding ATPase YchF (GTP1/OBG family)
MPRGGVMSTNDWIEKRLREVEEELDALTKEAEHLMKLQAVERASRQFIEAWTLNQNKELKDRAFWVLHSRTKDLCCG